MLQRYKALSDKHVKEPVRVVSLNESMSAAAPSGSGTGVESGPVMEGTEGAPSSGIEADVVDTVPKTMQVKARRLMEHLKRDIALTARGELIHEGVPIVGSNVVDLVNDLLRKRKTDNCLQESLHTSGDDDSHSVSSSNSCWCELCTEITQLNTPRSST